jgi:signal transduction histidine kinase
MVSHLTKENESSPAVLDSMPFLEECAKNRTEIIIDDNAAFFAERKILRHSQDIFAMNSLVIVPLIVEDRLIAILSVQSKQMNAYNAYNLDIIRALASYTAIALDNAHAYKTVQDINQEKNMLLGVVAHDLKTPLSGIILASSNLEAYWERMNREQIFDRMKAIKQTSLNMAHFIEDLLDVSAIESGKIRLHIEECIVSEIVRKCSEQIIEQASQKNILIQTHIENEQISALADYRRTTQILENLLSNALKFSPKGSIIHIYLWERNSLEKPPFEAALRHDLHTVIAVRDEGPGVSDEDKQQLFGKFVRLSAKPTGGEHSSGLGLAIVKRLSEAMHGEVWCESTVGQGATFCVALPKYSSVKM